MQVQKPLAVITPTLDGDVLGVLAVAEASFTPGDVARLLPDASIEGIRKVLKRLAGQGTVTVERVGNAYTYQLNREHLAALAIIELANLRATLFARIEANINGWRVAPLYGAVFGSAARGQMRSDSDIDIFLVRPDDTDLTDWESQTGELAGAVTRWTGNDARILDMSEREVNAGAASGEPVLLSIVDEGVAIVGSPRWLRSLLRAAVRS